MAFLGSLGKSLGLSSSFGKGLATGLATSIDEGIKDDMKRTQDNIDDLVVETYKGAVESKKEFDKMYKENKKLVENIAANMGGEQGLNHPQALQAAQTLINLKGLDGAFSIAQDYNKAFRFYGKHPTKSLLADETGNSTPITLSALTKSTLAPISIPDTSALGESANVGFMKANFLGAARDSSSEISTRAEALIKARGIDVNEQTIELPPALKGKVDPLILGMKENPVEEKARLLTILGNAERDGTLTNEKEANIKSMMDVTEGIIRSMEKKKGLDMAAIQSNVNNIQQTLNGMYRISDKRNKFGIYIGSNAQVDQTKILNQTSNYYLNFINEATRYGDKEDGYKNFQEIYSAIINNQELTAVTINGVYTIQAIKDSEYLDSASRLILNPKDEKKDDPIQKLEKNKIKDISTLSPSQIVGEVKNLPNVKSLNSKTRVKRKMELEQAFVKQFIKDNPGATIDIATKEFNKQIAG
tara:strand:- start:1476 stop:2894 length:1419 start_codon:yes stop_codon:yes gene_type:complete